jgi:WD40 repeat protein
MAPSKMKSAAFLLLAFSFLAVRTGAEEGSPRLDAQGDPLPDEAVSRLGTTRLRDGGVVTGLAFTPDGKLLISDGTDGVRFWDAVTGKQLRHYPKQLGMLAHQNFSLSPDGTLIAILLAGAIHLFDVNTNKEVRSFGAKDALYYSLRFSPNGQKIAALCGFEKNPLTDDHGVLDKRLETWEVARGRKLTSQDIGFRDPYLLGWLDEKAPVVLEPRDDKICLWDPAAGDFRRQFLVGDRTYGILTASGPDGLLASICDDEGVRCLRIWNLATGKEMLHLGAYKYTDLPIIDSSKYLETVAFACDGKTLVTGAEDGTLIVWDAVTGGEVRRFVHAISDTKALAVSVSPS